MIDTLILYWGIVCFLRDVVSSQVIIVEFRRSSSVLVHDVVNPGMDSDCSGKTDRPGGDRDDLVQGF